MTKKQTGWPFQEGYVIGTDGEVHVFTDYRWNDGSVTRRWLVGPELVDLKIVVLRPFSPEAGDSSD